MKFLLTSAGLCNDAIKGALLTMTDKSFGEMRVVFITTAANTGHDDKRWLLANLNQFDRVGVSALDIIDIAGLPKSTWYPHLEKADVICVGGGDERYLARVFADQGMANELVELLASRVYMGISAGSMVVGRYLTSDQVREIFPEEDFGDTSGEGLGFVSFAFVPHLNSTFFSLRPERLDAMAERFMVPVYATDDETALSVIDGVVTKVGSGEFLHYGS